MFRRRIFYDLTSGDVLRSYTVSRTFTSEYTAEQEAAYFGYENWGTMEWNEPDPDIEAAFAEVDNDGNPRHVEVSVNVSRKKHKLVFEYSPIEERQPKTDEQEDMMAALALLGVVPEEGA